MTLEMKVTIQAGGKYTVETSGFKGKGCEQASEDLIKKLGGATVTELKPEHALAGRDPKIGHYQG